MKKPLVGILMGSDSDLGVMKAASEILTEFGIENHMTVLSAHRTPKETVAYVRKGEARGMKVFICGAGGAAHLAGMVAAHTPLPVIGVPVMNKTAAGVDALFSTAQMPPGIPVATVAINGAKNAGILAAEIIGASDARVRKAVVSYKKKLAGEVLTKAAKLEKQGFKKYLETQGLI